MPAIPKKLQVPHKVKLGLRLASDIVGKLPSRGDTALQVVVKLLAVVDSAQNILSPISKGSLMDSLVERYNLVQTKNEQFVSLFFDTNLYQQFEINRFTLTDYMQAISAYHPKFGRLFFTEYSYSHSGPEDIFYHSKDMPIPEILQRLWDTYDGRLHVTIAPKEHGGSKTEFAPFHAGETPVYGPTKERLEALIGRHQAFTGDGFPRSYMFYGKAGSGKSTAAMLVASRLGKRTVKMDAVSLAHAHVKEITFLLNNLKPDFIIFDDVDKADVSKGIPTILDIVQRFKTEHKSTSIIMTSNTISFDEGLLRPGRIDTWIEFPSPDDEERRILLTEYMVHYEVTPPMKSTFMAIVRATEGLSQDYIREVALQLRYDSGNDVLKNVQRMQALLKENKAPAPPGGPAPKATPESKPSA